jgi:hypothetical protein
MRPASMICCKENSDADAHILVKKWRANATPIYQLISDMAVPAT